MAVRFKAIVNGDIPANRFVVLNGRTDEDVILLTLADRTTAVDFVSTEDLTDGQEITTTLNEGLRFWNVEAEIDMEAGQWVSSGTDGKALYRTGNTVECAGYTLAPAKAGEIVKVLRRESLSNEWGTEVSEDIEDLKARVLALESGGE